VGAAESAESALSIVIGAHGPEAALEACLASLSAQRDGAEVIVCEERQSSEELRRRFLWARFIDCHGGRVPHLWREGIERSRGAIVALTNSNMVPADDWVATLMAEHGERDVVAGAIEPGQDMPLATFAEYLCRYAADMLPFEGHECQALPGDNASYKRELLETTRDLYRDGFWEPVVHRRLDAEGICLWHSPALVVRQGRSAGAGAFISQRLVHGRAHGRQRGVHFSPIRNAAGALGAPLVAPLMTLRILRQVWARRRLRFKALAALPLVVVFNAAWAAGEARGHIDALRLR
jgi:hypothetical protein